MSKIWKWMNTWIGTLIICELLIAGMSLWVFTWFNDQVAAPDQSVIGGYEGSYMDVSSESEVCVTAVSETGDFEVDTPSGKLVPSAFVGKYSVGSGCFAPGRWQLVKNPPLMQLQSSSNFKAISYTPNSVRYRGPLGLFAIMQVMILLIAFSIWSRYSRQEEE